MILSHEYRFIFIKTSKTAGTSVELALSRYCGPGDIITPLHADDEATRSALGGRGPQNCYAPPWDYKPKDIGRLLLRGRRKLVYYNHISARELRDRLSPEVWNGYFKFCIERNPFDRMISSYYWRQAAGGRRTLTNFIAEKGYVPKQHGYNLYAIDGKIAVNHVLRYENLQTDLDEVARHLDLPTAPELPFAKSSHRKDRRPYAEVLSSEDRAMIEELYADEIRIFNYPFEGTLADNGLGR